MYPAFLLFTHLALVVLATSPAGAIIQLKVQQVGGNVVVTGSGTANTTGLTAAGSDNDYTNVLTDTQIYSGPHAFGDSSGAGADVSLWSGLSGPLLFGSDPSVSENPCDPTIVGCSGGSGDFFGIVADNFASTIGAQRLVLPLGYSSGASLNGTSTFTGITLAQLGLSAGTTFTWTWGSGATVDSLHLEVSEPDPVPAPLPIAGAAATFTGIRRLRRLSTRIHA